MSPNDKCLAASGNVEVTVFDKDGNIRDRYVHHNRVVDGGLELIASLIAGEDNDPQYISRPTYCAIGNGEKDVESTDTALQSELYRKAFDSVVRTNNNVEFTTTFLPAEPALQMCKIFEAGLFNANVGGTMFARVCISQISKYQDDTLQIKWTITLNAVSSPYDSSWEDKENVPIEP